ncbi:cytochrome c4 [Solimonas sp. K1W22B-7]|uniref:c-type cytochrome n=1 Tax=Solimonas sp. K1W22B-7 TaxID=2303331 RepID=UPI000E32E6B3|nr:c-type cytochrome [Solimonas sp. K1W22B-7]AXQ28471.1 cytochrome c4 [Solimonas sp. K1W22B-7]
MRWLSPRHVALAMLALTAAMPGAAAGDAAEGEAAARDLRCLECHERAVDGSPESGRYPRLAGQRYDYLVRQLRDFRDGRRRNDLMFVLARNLEDNEIQDLAAYFSSLAAGRGQGSAGLGLQLFQGGDPARGVPACASCHDAGIAGAPRIDGQHAPYLSSQLRAWRAGERGAAADGPMGSIAAPLSDADIDALADHISRR